MNTDLLVFDPVDGGRQTVTEFLDTLPDVADWHASLNSAVVVVSAATPTDLTVRLRDRFPGVSFVFTQIGFQTADGILPRATWNFLQRGPVGAA